MGGAASASLAPESGVASRAAGIREIVASGVRRVCVAHGLASPGFAGVRPGVATTTLLSWQSIPQHNIQNFQLRQQFFFCQLHNICSAVPTPLVSEPFLMPLVLSHTCAA